MCAVIAEKMEFFGKNHVMIPWHDSVRDESVPIKKASIKDRATLIGRAGMIELSCGTGAWRVRDSMNILGRVIGVAVTADVGLTSINFSVSDNDQFYSESLTLTGTGVNTEKLMQMENFMDEMVLHDGNYTLGEVHRMLDEIDKAPQHWGNVSAGLASGLACSSFTFLLGGGLTEMAGAFVGAAIGHYVRKKMLGRKLQLVLAICTSVAAACLSYELVFLLLRFLFHVETSHEAGYIGSMLFIIPGFPLITSGLDMAKQDMRSGLERLGHALVIIVSGTMTGWLVAYFMHIQPGNFLPLGLSPLTLFLLRLPASFCGVFGFSTMYNSSPKMSTTAGLIGMISNTLRLELIDLFGIPGAAAAFIDALVSGLIASKVHHRLGYPRIALTVPSIVIMVPGMFMYKSVYYLGTGALSVGMGWMTKAILMVVCMPLGLLFARVLTDRRWRYDN